MAPATNRNTSAFKPPRPKSVATTPKSKTTKSAKSSKTTKSRKSNISAIDSSASSSEAASPPSSEPDFLLAELVPATPEPEDDTPKIPEKLILTLLNNSFQNKEKTKVGTGVASAVGKYVDVFVRETLARSVFERTERQKEDGMGGMGDGFLEVSATCAPTFEGRVLCAELIDE
jgi:hypothetical protein